MWDSMAECFVCGKFMRKNNLMRHARLHMNIDRTVECFHCHKNIVKQYLFMHDLSHRTAKRTVQCFECRKCVLKANFHLHVRVHLQGGRCNNCETNFASFSAYASHLPCSSWICSGCNSTFPSKKQLMAHIRYHSPDRTILCYDCNQRMKSKYFLRGHKCFMQYLVDSRWKCPHCDFRSGHATRLKNHVQAHENGKAYECFTCSRAFRYLRNCASHVVIHQEKLLPKSRFRCHVCAKGYPRKNSLGRHLNYVHGFQRKISVNCPDCNRTYAYAETMSKHRLAMHKKEPQILCDGCLKPFRYKNVLLNHVLKEMADKLKAVAAGRA